MTRIRKHLNYANVMVTVLVFVVLGGTAWALAKNTVGSKQLKENAVKTSDIADGAVTAAKVAAGVLPGDPTVRTKTETVPMSCTETSFPGPTTTYFVTCSGQATIIAACETGEHAVSGGYKTPSSSGTPAAGANISDSRPEPTSGTPTAWAARVSAFGTNSATSSPVPRPADPEVSVYAVCST
jgi:hypothetical protein